MDKNSTRTEIHTDTTEQEKFAEYLFEQQMDSDCDGSVVEQTENIPEGKACVTGVTFTQDKNVEISFIDSEGTKHENTVEPTLPKFSGSRYCRLYRWVGANPKYIEDLENKLIPIKRTDNTVQIDYPPRRKRLNPHHFKYKRILQQSEFIHGVDQRIPSQDDLQSLKQFFIVEFLILFYVSVNYWVWAPFSELLDGRVPAYDLGSWVVIDGLICIVLLYIGSLLVLNMQDKIGRLIKAVIELTWFSVVSLVSYLQNRIKSFLFPYSDYK